jgi:hypothetical protein
MKRKVLHVQKGIVMIAEQGCKGLINDLEDYGFEEGMPCPTPHKILAPEVFWAELIREAHNSNFAEGDSRRRKDSGRIYGGRKWTRTYKSISTNVNHARRQQTRGSHQMYQSQDYQSHEDLPKESMQTSLGHYRTQNEETGSS